MAYVPFPGSSPPASGGGGGATVHNDLTGRSASNAHPMAAITGLLAALDDRLMKNPVVTTDETYTADGTESMILTGGTAVVLADPADFIGQRVAVVNGNPSDPCEITADGDGTILGQPSFTLGPGGNAVIFEAADADDFEIGPTWAVIGTTGSQFNLPDWISGRDPGEILGIDGEGRPQWADFLGDYTKTTDFGGAAFLDVGTAAGEVAAGDAAPNAHAASHGPSGSDPIAPTVKTNLLISGRYTRSGQRSAAATVTNNRLYYVPVMIDETTTFDRVAVNHEATAAGALSVARIGIYPNAAGNVPGNLLLDCGSIDLSTAAALKPLTINQQLTRGLWWFGVVTQVTSGSPTLAVAAPYVGVPDVAAQSSGTLFENGISGALPTTPAPGTAVTTQPPVVYLRPV